MNHQEKLIRQYYEWKGYIVRGNIKVGRLKHGGWAGELYIVAYLPENGHLIHLEPSIDSLSWERREPRFKKKFQMGRKYIRKEVFPWLDRGTPIEQVAILITSSRKTLAGARIQSIDEFMSNVKNDVIEMRIMAKNAIPQEFDLLRTIQMAIRGYHGTGSRSHNETLKSLAQVRAP